MSKNLDKMSPDELVKAKKWLARGWGEIVEYKWTEVEEVEKKVPVEGGKKGETTAETDYVAHERVNKYLVGKMDLFMTTGVVSILAAVFANGAQFKALTGRNDNVAFLEFIDEFNLSALLSLIMGEDREWIVENWDMMEVIKVIKTFFKYNDFFALLKEVATIGESLNLDEDKARKLALGQTTLIGG